MTRKRKSMRSGYLDKKQKEVNEFLGKLSYRTGKRRFEPSEDDAKCDYCGRNVSKRVHWKDEQGRIICENCRKHQMGTED